MEKEGTATDYRQDISKVLEKIPNNAQCSQQILDRYFS